MITKHTNAYKQYRGVVTIQQAKKGIALQKQIAKI
jgi:hypothetical protein